ncbi:MAG TPA: tetratricopeptide repeat protein, partial [Blastocatellia bacterium]|nr:tetratricopeptide repeat protein [Blastocatellia bacterium]
MKTRAQILEAADGRQAAEVVYSSAFDPNWPRAVATDYYDLLRRFGRYRIVRRDLQTRVRAGAADLDTIGRMFSILSYEGNYAQASRLLRSLEDRRAGHAPQTGQQESANQTVTSPAGAWPASELETVASLFASIGAYDQASRYLYTLYLSGGLAPGSQSREDALYRLFEVMMDSAGTPTRVASGDLSFYRDVATLDQHPGFMNGVLSLILSGTDPAAEFAAGEKAAAGYFNRVFAYRIFTSFKQEYPASPRLARMYLGVIDVFSSLGEHRLAIQVGREFQQKFPDSPSYIDVSLKIADCYVALKDRTNERAVLFELLDRSARNVPKGMPLVPASSKRWSYGSTPQADQLIDKIKYNIEAYGNTYDPAENANAVEGSEESSSDESEGQENPESRAAERVSGPASYGGVLERYIASLSADNKKTETVAFFWGQIKKHPGQEGLYERFLGWLGQANLINEQLSAYNSAIRQFGSNTWYHRMARWYVRQKRGKELSRYSRELIGIFDEDDITEYLLRFAGYGPTAAGDEMNWDEAVAFDLYSYAHNRFPRNLFFVRGMLTYLEKHDRANWEKLSIEYYFADRSIREPYLAWLSNQGQLRDKYAQAVARSSGAAVPGAGAQAQPGGPGLPAPAVFTDSVEGAPRLRPPTAGAGALTTYRVFAADAAVWLSHYDKAVEAYRDLVAAYPGEPQYAQRLADIARSFGQQDEGFYDESARVLSQMAEIYPSDHTYRIKAGEAYAERGEFKLAGEQWDKLTGLEPGEASTYLEVATVYWDYYQFDQAIRVLKDLRQESGDQTIYAYRLGAVYEGKGDLDSAIEEYVKVLPEPGEGRDTVTKRLAQLSRRQGGAEKIAAAYNRARAAHPGDWQLLIGYASYLVQRDDPSAALDILRAEVGKSRDVAFLETMRDLFRGILRPEDEQHTISRLAAVARDEHEAIMYDLQLASFLEHHKQVAEGVKVIDGLVAEHPTNLGVIEESAQFYWRAALRDRTLDLYKRTITVARGTNRRRLILELAGRQMDAARPADSETTLRALYAENPLDSEVFSELNRALGAQNKLADMAALYQDAFKQVRESGLSVDDARARVASLRTGMIDTLAGLGKYEEAVDQYIEIINSFPEDSDKLAAAADFAERHNLSGRLISYYEKLTKQAYKNYRWELVLARLYERQDNLPGASEQYRLAVVNEPQRSDLRFTLAALLGRQQRYDEAIATLREGWALAGRDPLWLIEVARVQLQQGKRDDAIQTIRQALAAKKNSTPGAQLAIASQLASWGLHGEAVRVYEQVFARLPENLKDDAVNSTEVTGYVRALVRTAPAATVFQKM